MRRAAYEFIFGKREKTGMEMRVGKRQGEMEMDKGQTIRISAQPTLKSGTVLMKSQLLIEG